jgi:hypothetical protein
MERQVRRRREKRVEHGPRSLDMAVIANGAALPPWAVAASGPFGNPVIVPTPVGNRMSPTETASMTVRALIIRFMEAP